MQNTSTRVLKTRATPKSALPSTDVARAPTVTQRPKKGSAEVRPGPGPTLNPQERERLIAQAAYFRAEKRGFAPGYELQDWVEAEAEVLQLVGAP